MLADSAVDGRRFLIGLALGSLAGSAVLASVAVVVGLGLDEFAVPADARRVALVALAALLGLADAMDRTPQVWRQVPQRLVRELSPGMLGTVWGIDLGLIVTTKKVTSLWWLGIIGLILVKPGLLPVAIPLGAVLTVLAIASWSVRVRGHTSCLMERQRTQVVQLRRASGTLMSVIAILLGIGIVI
jgi:hypothetical protein